MLFCTVFGAGEIIHALATRDDMLVFAARLAAGVTLVAGALIAFRRKG